MKPFIHLEDVHHDYSGAGRTVHALRGVTLDVHAREFVAIVGPSGSGKTTLLNIIGTIDRPSSGRYLFDDRDIVSLPDSGMARFRAEHIGFVFQSFNLIEHLTVYENIKLGLRYRHHKLVDEDDRVMAAMDRVAMAHRADHFPRQLSGGQQQRCAIARAIVGNPSVLLADEPTGNLDTINARQVLGILREMNDKGTTVVIVTHSPSQADFASRIVELQDGRVHFMSRRPL